MKTKKSIKELKTGFFIALAASFMLFLYAPLELFFYNKSEFWFDVYVLMPVLLAMFLALFVASMLIFGLLYLIHRRLYQVGIAVYFIAYICSYIQGNFLVHGLPALAGSPIFWEQYPQERMKCIAMWIVVTVIVVVAIIIIRMQKFCKVTEYVSIFITLMLLLTIVTVCIANNGLENKLSLCVTDQEEFTMSEDTNYIILLLDSLDARTFSKVLAENEQYQEGLADFTYYPNMVGAYGYTEEAVPQILSGVWFENQEPFAEYQMNVYRNSALFSELENRSYRLGMYDEDVPLTDECVLRFENISESQDTLQSLLKFAKYQARLVGYKYAPFDFKKACVFDKNVFLSLKMAPEGSKVFQWDDDFFYQDTNNTQITYVPEKCFKFIHLEGAHAPFIYDAELNNIGWDNGTYESMTQACFKLVITYLNKLKAAGVYDNSVIIVMSDHGYEEDDDPWGRWNPAFFVKGVNERHELNISNAPVSYDDLQKAYVRLMDGAKSIEIFDWKEGDYRERRYMYYEYNKPEHLYETIQVGPVDDLNSVTYTGVEYHAE